MVMNWSSAPRTTPNRRSSDRRYLHHDTILQGAHHVMSHGLNTPLLVGCTGSQASHASPRSPPSLPISYSKLNDTSHLHSMVMSVKGLNSRER